MHEEEQNESDQRHVVQLFGQFIVVALFGQIVAADHQIGDDVAERREHQQGASTEQVDRVGGKPCETSETKVDFLGGNY